MCSYVCTTAFCFLYIMTSWQANHEGKYIYIYIYIYIYSIIAMHASLHVSDVASQLNLIDLEVFKKYSQLAFPISCKKPGTQLASQLKYLSKIKTYKFLASFPYFLQKARYLPSQLRYLSKVKTYKFVDRQTASQFMYLPSQLLCE